MILALVALTSAFLIHVILVICALAVIGILLHWLAGIWGVPQPLLVVVGILVFMVALCYLFGVSPRF